MTSSGRCSTSGASVSAAARAIDAEQPAALGRPEARGAVADVIENGASRTANYQMTPAQFQAATGVRVVGSFDDGTEAGEGEPQRP
mgnify:CR=1 FL=1